MKNLLLIWPTLGDRPVRAAHDPRGFPSSTKKGPGRYHLPGRLKTVLRRDLALENDRALLGGLLGGAR